MLLVDIIGEAGDYDEQDKDDSARPNHPLELCAVGLKNQLSCEVEIQWIRLIGITDEHLDV